MYLSLPACICLYLHVSVLTCLYLSGSVCICTFKPYDHSELSFEWPFDGKACVLAKFSLTHGLVYVHRRRIDPTGNLCIFACILAIWRKGWKHQRSESAQILYIFHVPFANHIHTLVWECAHDAILQALHWPKQSCARACMPRWLDIFWRLHLTRVWCMCEIFFVFRRHGCCHDIDHVMARELRHAFLCVPKDKSWSLPAVHRKLSRELFWRQLSKCMVF